MVLQYKIRIFELKIYEITEIIISDEIIYHTSDEKIKVFETIMHGDE
jgi:hypothetical protein